LRIKRVFLKIINGFWAIPVVLFIRAIRPFFYIKFLQIRSNRIGSFVFDSVYQIILKLRQKKNFYSLLCFEEPTSNDYWAKFIKRQKAINQWSWYLYYWNKKIPRGDKHIERSYLTPLSRDLIGLFEKSRLNLNFQSKENIKGYNWLKSKGYSDGEPFVCVMVRDSAYLESNELAGEYDFSYHNYRNSNIEDYLPALDWLTDQGVWVIRMGKVMENPILTKNERIIDYPFLKEWNSFLDIWLFANCDLCISTGSGPDCISDVFRRPLLFLNFLPPKGVVSWSNSMTLLKKLSWGDSGKELTLKESIKYDSLTSFGYEDKNILVSDLSSEEITTSVKECWNSMRDHSEMKKDDKAKQDRFWEILKSEPNSKGFQGLIHPKAKIGINWLRNKGEDYLL